MQEFNFDAYESYAKIVVIGVGGAGNNAVNQMIEEKIANIDFWVVNTDAQALATSRAEHKYVLGKDYTKGLGAGGNPEIGKNAAESSLDDLKEIVARGEPWFSSPPAWAGEPEPARRRSSPGSPRKAAR